MQMIGNLSHAYSNTHFFLACGPMSEAYCDEVNTIISNARQQNIKAHFLDHRGFLNKTNACCGHPSVTADIAMAKNTSDFISATLGW